MPASGSRRLATALDSDIARDIAPQFSALGAAGTPPAVLRSGLGSGVPVSVNVTSSWTAGGAVSAVAACGLAERLSPWLAGRLSRTSDWYCPMKFCRSCASSVAAGSSADRGDGHEAEMVSASRSRSSISVSWSGAVGDGVPVGGSPAGARDAGVVAGRLASAEGDVSDVGGSLAATGAATRSTAAAAPRATDGSEETAFATFSMLERVTGPARSGDRGDDAGVRGVRELGGTTRAFGVCTLREEASLGAGSAAGVPPDVFAVLLNFGAAGAGVDGTPSPAAAGAVPPVETAACAFGAKTVAGAARKIARRSRPAERNPCARTLSFPQFAANISAAYIPNPARCDPPLYLITAPLH